MKIAIVRVPRGKGISKVSSNIIIVDNIVLQVYFVLYYTLKVVFVLLIKELLNTFDPSFGIGSLKGSSPLNEVYNDNLLVKGFPITYRL